MAARDFRIRDVASCEAWLAPFLMGGSRLTNQGPRIQTESMKNGSDSPI